MKKKLFTLMTLLLCICSTAWGQSGDLLNINFTDWYNDGGTTQGNAHYINTASSGTYKRSNVAYFTNSAYSTTAPSATNYVCLTCSTSTYNVYAKNNTDNSSGESRDCYPVTQNSNTTADVTLAFTLSSAAKIEILAGASSIGNTSATYSYTAPNAANAINKSYIFLSNDYNYSTGSYSLANDNKLNTKNTVVYITETTTSAGTASFSFNAGKLYGATGTNNKKFYIYAIRVTSVSSSYTVTYNNNGGTGTIANSTGTNITLSDGTGVTAPTGYSFAGWNTANDGSGTSYTAGQTGINKSLDLFATWTQSATVDANGGSANSTYTATLNATSIAIASAPTNAGTTLTGYFDAATGGNKIANADGTLVASTSCADANSKWNNNSAAPMLFAQWEAATYTVTVAKNNNAYGTVTSASVADVAYNTTVSATDNVLSVGTTDITATAADATAEYTYAFNNWTGIPEGGKVTDNVTVTANFTRTPVNYTLSWNKNAEDADDLTGTYTTGTVAFGTAITTPNPPTRTGYTFQGWAETADGDVVEVPATMPAADKSYYAKWAVYVAPTAGVLFSADVTATSNQSFSSGTTEVTSSQATITGGRVYAVNGQDSGKNLIATQSNVGYFCMTNNNTIFKIVLNDPLAEGDVITANGIGGTKSGDSYNKGLWVSSSDSRPTSVPACSGTSATESLQTPILNYTVTSDDEYVGKTTLYIHRAAGSSTYFDNVVITRKNSITLNNVSGAAYGFSTFCSPNNFTVTGATAYKASLDDGKLNLTALSGIIPAGAGVILAAEKGAKASITYTTSAATADMDGNALGGTTARTLTATLKGDNTYFYAFQNTTNTFKQYNGEYFPANKAYVVSNAQLSRGISMDFGETTGISNVDVNANDNFDVNAPMYNLAGQKVGKSYKGIVIVNGKKVVRK